MHKAFQDMARNQDIFGAAALACFRPGAPDLSRAIQRPKVDRDPSLPTAVRDDTSYSTRWAGTRRSPTHSIAQPLAHCQVVR